MKSLIVVTGASKGIGRAIATDLRETGASVFCTARAYDYAPTENDIWFTPCDLSDRSSVQELAGCLVVAAGGYDRVSIVAAAGTLDRYSHCDYDDWDRVFRVNLFGHVAIFSALVPRMRETGFGRLVMFAGGGAAYAFHKFPAYAGSKTALVRTVENIAQEMAGTANFSAVALAPGAVETDMLKAVVAAGAEVKTHTAIEEPVRFVRMFLASAHAPSLSGHFVHVRDPWMDVLTGMTKPWPNMWKLRRIENGT